MAKTWALVRRTPLVTNKKILKRQKCCFLTLNGKSELFVVRGSMSRIGTLRGSITTFSDVVHILIVQFPNSDNQPSKLSTMFKGLDRLLPMHIVTNTDSALNKSFILRYCVLYVDNKM